MADILERTLDTGGDTEESLPTHDDSGRRICRNMQDLFAYAFDAFDRCEQHMGKNILKHLKSQLGRTNYTTAFSGIDAPGVALGVLTCCLQDRLPNKSVNKPRHLSGVEWVGNVRDELLHHPSAPECLFEDITDFLQVELRSTIQELKKQKGDITFDDLVPLIEEAHKSEGWKYVSTSAHCVVHNKQCAHRRARLHIAGTPCVD
eukprot:2221254-Karenia_brevis.AAC.1